MPTPAPEVPQWFKRLLDAAVKKAGNQSRLAEKIDVSQSTISNYYSGSTPGMTVLERLFVYVGGDITRAMPDWEPDHSARERLVKKELTRVKRLVTQIQDLASEAMLNPLQALEKEVQRELSRTRSERDPAEQAELPPVYYVAQTRPNAPADKTPGTHPEDSEEDDQTPH